MNGEGCPTADISSPPITPEIDDIEYHAQPMDFGSGVLLEPTNVDKAREPVVSLHPKYEWADRLPALPFEEVGCTGFPLPDVAGLCRSRCPSGLDSHVMDQLINRIT